MKRKLIGILLALGMLFGMSAPAFAATTADVTITFTLQSLALTNDTATWAVGTVLPSTAYWWTTDGNAPSPEPFEAADMIATITNTGNVAEDVDVHTHASTGGAGMTVSTDDSPAAGEFSLRAGFTGTTNEAAMIQVITTNTELISNLAAAGTKKWCMELETPPSGDAAQQTTTVTLTCRAVS
jgi:hypothetical protein